MATSLDGFIARTNGDLDWLNQWPESGHDYGYSDFMASIDGLIMGRRTYEKVLTFGEWSYSKPVIVLSRSLDLNDLRPDLMGKVRISRSRPAEVISEIGGEGWMRAYLDGGQVIQAFLREGLVEDMVLTRIPILLGAGLPLFGTLQQDAKLKHLKTTAYSSGFVQSHYAIQQTDLPPTCSAHGQFCR
jgi:dihydrofolate reductase